MAVKTERWRENLLNLGPSKAEASICRKVWGSKPECGKNEKKTLRETQTLPLRRRVPRWPKFNLEMVTTFTYRPSLVKIDARNFELFVVTDPQTQSQTHR